MTGALLFGAAIEAINRSVKDLLAHMASAIHDFQLPAQLYAKSTRKLDTMLEMPMPPSESMRPLRHRDIISR
jgi:hypothetical protein